MYLKRKIDRDLQAWKNDPDRMPLIVRGARQIGKTRAIRHFAESSYKSVVEINFAEEPKFKAIINDGYSAADVVRNISMLAPAKRFIEGETLIFFDELTEFPEIATSLKFFREDGRYDVICSGSLLGMQYKRIESNSVGNKEDIDMYSMDFEEFLWARGYSDDIRGVIVGRMLSGEPFNAAEYETFSRLFLDYCILGGMPAVVAGYMATDTFEGANRRQRQIIRDYEEDIRKYLDGLEQTRVMQVFRQIPIQLARENKKFQISKVAKGAKNKDYRGCIEWLSDAGIINVCRGLHFPELPLSGSYEEDKYKLYMADTGLLISLLEKEVQDDLRANKNLGAYKGALYENMIGEALKKDGYELYYYKKENSTLEEDFFVRSADALIPIEVKATNSKSKSLSTLINSNAYPDIRFGIKLTGSNLGVGNHIYTLPHFCAFVLREYIRNMDFE